TSPASSTFNFTGSTGMKLPVTTVVNSANNATVYASCGAGKFTVLGGGCSQTQTNSVRTSCPATASGTCFASTQAAPSQQAAGAAGWSCTFAGSNAANTAYVICLSGI